MKSMYWTFTVILAALIAAGLVATAPIPSISSGGSTAIRSFDEISLSRSGCYGQCPNYRLVVRGTGEVEYEGLEFVKVEGKATAQLTPRQLEALLLGLNNVRYFTLRDSYGYHGGGCPVIATDHPSAITSVKAEGRLKTISHDYGCQENPVAGKAGDSRPGKVHPRELTQFEFEIDRVVGSERWVGDQ